MITSPSPPVRWGLCCQFLDAPIRFRTATHRYVHSLGTTASRAYLSGIARDNATALVQAIEHCHALGIGAFRINSQILPLGTHPASGYSLDKIDSDGSIRKTFLDARVRAQELDVRLSFHPDQFVVLNSERESVVASSIQEMEFQAGIAELVGADTIVLHGGGSSGGMSASLDRLARGIERLAPRARSRLALENDDRRFAPADLLPLCRRLGMPLVYDVHHHRCHPDRFSVAEATQAMLETWGRREPWVHLSSPREGWSAADPRPHAPFIDPSDLPDTWRGLRLTIDVEAKEKERAVLAIKEFASRASVQKRPARNTGKTARLTKTRKAHPNG